MKQDILPVLIAPERGRKRVSIMRDVLVLVTVIVLAIVVLVLLAG